MFRDEIILDQVRGKRVLDCGGVDHYAFQEKSASGDWLHAKIAAQAQECIGLDILKERVEEVNKLGRYKFIEGNVEKMSFDREFDVVVAGEIIEHVYNAGLFLDSVWRSLRENGKLIVTTPNAYSMTGILYAMLARRERCHPEHTCYYSPQTLQYLISRHGFTIERFYPLSRPAKSKWIGAMRALVLKTNPLLSEKLLIVASKNDRKILYNGVW